MLSECDEKLIHAIEKEWSEHKIGDKYAMIGISVILRKGNLTEENIVECLSEKKEDGNDHAS